MVFLTEAKQMKMQLLNGSHFKKYIANKLTGKTNNNQIWQKNKKKSVSVVS